MHNRRAWVSRTVVAVSLAVALLLATAAFLDLFRPTFAASDSSVDYTYIGNVGNVVSTWSENGDLVNPTMIAYSAGSSNFIYVYCDSTAMPYASGGLISGQATPASWRTIVIFSDNGDGTFTYQSMVTIEIAGSGFSFNGGEPQGMTVDSNGVIYMTAPTNALVAVYQSNTASPTVQTPTFIGPTSASNGYTGSVLGAPSIDHTDGSVIVGGDFNGGSALGYATYGVAKIIPTSPTAATDAPQLFVPYTSGSNNYYVENVAVSSSGNHLAAGYFSINGQSYNVIEVDLTNGAITPITPLNITGLNNSQESASIYGMTSIKSDANGNIYLSGSFGVNNAGQYEASSLLKLDQNGNFVTDIAPQTNTATTTGQLSGPNMLAVNGINQWVYIVDTANSAGAAVRAFAFNGTLPGSGNTTPNVTIPPSSVNLDPNTGVVFAAPPTGGGIITITNRAQSVFGCDTTQPPSVVLIVNTDDISSGIPINTSILNPSTNTSVATSFVVYPDGSTTMALTTGSDGATTSGTGTPTTSGGVTTATINLTAADGTTLTNTVTTSSDASGGTAIYSTKTITQPDGYTSTTAIRIATTATGEIDLSVQLSNITAGNSYCTSISTNNGSGAATPITVPWTAGLPDSSISFSEVYCSTNPFTIDILPSAAGTLGTDCVTITTATNNPTGYNTTFNTSSANLVCTTDSGPYSLAPASSAPAALGNNQWGYSIGTDTPSVFQAVPTVAAIVQSNTGSTIGDSFMLWIGAQLDLSQPACTYTGTITMTASANPVPTPAITSISPTSGATGGSAPITVTGANFGTTDIPFISQISVGGATCLFLAVVDNATATCIAPALAAGTYDVSVEGFGGIATLPSSYTAE
ncbi:IPT/TIG domain-containing protein [Candidatus Saccharibacteria bacterium]|nr:IPT/TIG domain-containing protein [Candidatus Saccharibacteria bacterium]